MGYNRARKASPGFPLKGVDVDMDVDSDMAVDVNWGCFKG